MCGVHNIAWHLHIEYAVDEVVSIGRADLDVVRSGGEGNWERDISANDGPTGVGNRNTVTVVEGRYHRDCKDSTVRRRESSI